MVTQNTDSIEYNNLYTQYDWFNKTFSPVVQQSGDDFFLPEFKLELIGISKNINTLMDKDSYFVTKIRIDKQHDMFFRTSEGAVSIILDRVLGKPGKRFNLNKMTDLEAKVITAYNDYLYNMLAQFLSAPPPTLKRTNFDIIHLTFIIKDIEENTVAKFIISIPEVLLKPQAVVSSGEKFHHADFPNSVIDVEIKIGSTKFSVFDMKNLEVEDIVVFENSNTNKMILKFKDYEKEIKLNPNLGLILPIDNNGGNNMGGNTENTNLWDSIEVEMNAQFDAVKITLGELKNIEEGLVVDLTSIYDNKITLSVENKAIARGELVIVNDRYGVRIEEVIAKGDKTKAVVQGSEKDDYEEFMDEGFDNDMNAGPEEFQGITMEEDEFDYSDFELEDEDI